ARPAPARTAAARTAASRTGATAAGSCFRPETSGRGRRVSKLWLPRRRHLAEGLGLDRRAFLLASLRAGGSAAAALALAGCDTNPRAVESVLHSVERWNERVERKIFRPGSRNVPSARAVAGGTKFPSYFIGDEMPVWDEMVRGVWRLEVGGMVRRP